MLHFLWPAQIYSFVEAAQMKPIEKLMYRSGCRVTILVLHCWNRYNFIRSLKPPKWSRLKSQCIGVGTLSPVWCCIVGTGTILFVRWRRPNEVDWKADESEWAHCHLFDVALLELVQFYSYVEVAQPKSIEKSMYRSGYKSNVCQTFPAWRNAEHGGP